MRQLLKIIDKYLSKLPALIFSSWLIYFFILYNTDWYTRNQELLDNIDTVLVFATIIHGLFFFGLFRFNNTKRILFLGIILVISLQYQYLKGLINQESYLITYRNYLIITLLVVVFEAWLNKDCN